MEQPLHMSYYLLLGRRNLPVLLPLVVVRRRADSECEWMIPSACVAVPSMRGVKRGVNGGGAGGLWWFLTKVIRKKIIPKYQKNDRRAE